ncbi:MAG: N-acetyltransferase family protein [Chloroflexota bacterium]
MNDAIRVQPIEPHHLDALLDLCREHAAYEKADFSENGQVERWRLALFSDPAALYGWVATDGGELIGFMTVTIDFATWSAEPFASMDCLYIREPHRGSGIGRLFLGQLRTFCAAHGCSSAEWQTPVDNKLGIGFYVRMGARALPKIRFRYEIDAQETAC